MTQERYWIIDHDLEGIARRFGTPVFVISESMVRERFDRVRSAFPQADVAYAVKANPTLHLMRFMTELGAGLEVVSEGEMAGVDLAGIAEDTPVFVDGPALNESEIEWALRRRAIINADSETILQTVRRTAHRLGFDKDEVRLRLGLRLNPGVSGLRHEALATGAKGSKFGVDPEEFLAIFRSNPDFEPAGLHFHVGSQGGTVQPIVDAAKTAAELICQLRNSGHRIEFLDIGGGLSVPYRKEDEGCFGGPEKLARLLAPILSSLEPIRVIIEPGRFLAAEAGVLLLRVLDVKTVGGRRWIIADGGADLLLRAAYLSDWYHEILVFRGGERLLGEDREVSIGGPGCFAADVIARERSLPAITVGDLLAVLTAGTYTGAMRTHYTGRGRATTVWIDASGWEELIARRPSPQSLYQFDV
jgi:diaminopimelate decarboxylase